MLSFSSVSKHFSSARAVDDLSFKVNSGEIFALLGPNGAGKTTTIRMIMQIIEPDKGSIDFDPIMMTDAKVNRQKLGYLPEERGLFQEASILSTLIYLGSLRGMDDLNAKTEALKWLERFGLDKRKNEKVSTLSKGNQQKVQFISSILHKPQFAVLDEPFSGFDPINQEIISDIIRELRNDGMTILLSAHQMQLIERIADRILLIQHGKELLSGSLDEIRKKTVSGQKLIIEFISDVNTSVLEMSDAIKGFQKLDDNTWEIYWGEHVLMNQLLIDLAKAGDIKSLKTSDVNLHEIFIQSFRNGN